MAGSSAGSGVQNASEQFVSCIKISFVNFSLNPTSQTKIRRIQMPDSNKSESDICLYEASFS